MDEELKSFLANEFNKVNQQFDTVNKRLNSIETEVKEVNQKVDTLVKISDFLNIAKQDSDALFIKQSLINNSNSAKMREFEYRLEQVEAKVV